MTSLRHLQLFEDFSLNEYHDHPHLKGYVMLLNKEDQVPSGYSVGDKAEYDFKNVNTGEVVQSMPVEVIEIYKDPQDNFVVVGKSESGTSWLFGSDDSKFHSLSDLRLL